MNRNLRISRENVINKLEETYPGLLVIAGLYDNPFLLTFIVSFNTIYLPFNVKHNSFKFIIKYSNRW